MVMVVSKTRLEFEFSMYLDCSPKVYPESAEARSILEDSPALTV